MTRDEIVGLLNTARDVLGKVLDWLPAEKSSATRSAPALAQLWKRSNKVMYGHSPRMIRDEIVDLLIEAQDVLREMSLWLPPESTPAVQGTPELMKLWEKVKVVAFKQPTPHKRSR